MAALEVALRKIRDGGGKAFVPYVTGGYPGVDAELLRTLASVGADAIEVGVPHSDPVMDGGVVQQASAAALAAGAHPADVFGAIADADVDVPVAVMTYANVVNRAGPDRFCDDARAAGVSGLIVPDLPVDEASELERVSGERGIDLVLLAAPGTGTERYVAIGAAARGFVYCVATYGVTGARDRLADTARQVVEAMRAHTDLPLLVGVGIAMPDHAAEACGFADGVIVGSSLMARMLDGDRDGLAALATEFRSAVPSG